jgi:tetratricopeptide (TPR) repeat protein
MRKYKLIVLLAIFGMVNLCVSNDVLCVESNFGVNDVSDDEMSAMLKALEKEKDELGKLKSEFNGTLETINGVPEEGIAKEVEKKKKVVLSDFVKKSIGKRRKSGGRQNISLINKEDGEVREIITLEEEEEYVGESEKVSINDEEEIIHPFEIAENLYKLGEYQAALDIYKLIVENNITKDEKMWISYQMANCYRKLNSYNEAVEAYSDIEEIYEGTYWAKQAQWHIQDIVWRAEAEEKLERVIER